MLNTCTSCFKDRLLIPSIKLIDLCPIISQWLGSRTGTQRTKSCQLCGMEVRSPENNSCYYSVIINLQRCLQSKRCNICNIWLSKKFEARLSHGHLWQVAQAIAKQPLVSVGQLLNFRLAEVSFFPCFSWLCFEIWPQLVILFLLIGSWVQQP